MCDVRRLELVDDLYSADGYEVLETVAEQVPDEVTTAMLVGHNPTMAQLAFLLGEGADEAAFPDLRHRHLRARRRQLGRARGGHGRLLASYTRDELTRQMATGS